MPNFIIIFGIKGGAMRLFIKNKKISNLVNKLDLTDGDTKVFGFLVETKEPKNKTQFKKFVKRLFTIEDEKLEPCLVVSDYYFCAKHKEILSYSDGTRFVFVENLKNKKEEVLNV